MKKRYKRIADYDSHPADSISTKKVRYQKFTGNNDHPKKPIGNSQKNNPLHGLKFADILNYLVARYGWETLSKKVSINCFKNNPTLKSSLNFLRKTAWAREKVETLFLRTK